MEKYNISIYSKFNSYQLAYITKAIRKFRLVWENNFEHCIGVGKENPIAWTKILQNIVNGRILIKVKTTS